METRGGWLVLFWRAPLLWWFKGTPKGKPLRHVGGHAQIAQLAVTFGFPSAKFVQQTSRATFVLAGSICHCFAQVWCLCLVAQSKGCESIKPSFEPLDVTGARET